jgi:type IV pilus assembly protein PilC
MAQGNAVVRSEMYSWEGIDRSGKRVKGEMSGQSETVIKSILRRQGVNPLKVKKKSKPMFGSSGGKITTKDITVFCRQLATMMSSGVPLVQSFEIVGRGHANKAMQQLILSIKADIEAGGALRFQNVYMLRR